MNTPNSITFPNTNSEYLSDVASRVKTTIATTAIVLSIGVSMNSPVNTTIVTNKINLTSSKVAQNSQPFTQIPESSPIYSLQNLEPGWDGYWAEPLSQDLLFKAQDVWDLIKGITEQEGDLPIVSPGANVSVAFTWSRYSPRKELEIWLYNEPDFYAEWLFSIEDSNNTDSEGTAQSWVELSELIKRFQEY